MFLKKRGNSKKYYKSLFSEREWSFGLCWFFVCLGGCFVFEIVLKGFWKHCCEFKDKLIAKVLSSKNSAGCLLICQLEKCGLRIYSCLKKIHGDVTMYIYHVWENWPANSASSSRLCRQLARQLCCCQSCRGSRVGAPSELEQTPAWLCPMGCVHGSSLGTIHQLLKALGALQSWQLSAFIILEALLKCPQTILQLLGFSLPKPL